MKPPDIKTCDIPIDKVEPDPDQARQHFDEEKLRGLADEIKRNGQLEPIGVVIVEADLLGEPSRYRVIYGERRLRAMKLLGAATIRADVRTRPASKDEQAAFEAQIVDMQASENLAREDLLPLELARSIRRVVDARIAANPKAKRGDVLERVADERGIAKREVYRILDLLELPAPAQELVVAHRVSREMACEFKRYWEHLRGVTKLTTKLEPAAQLRTLVNAYAVQNGLAPDSAEAAREYASENARDPREVKALVKAAAVAEREALDKLRQVIHRATKEEWSGKATRAYIDRLKKKLRGGRGGDAAVELPESPSAAAQQPEEPALELYEYDASQRLTIHLARVRNPQLLTESRREMLLDELRRVTEVVQAAVAGPTS